MSKEGTRSKPPPWMSMTGPISCRIMALHSMCQPGRPGPQGESQVGSPGLADFQRAKSEGLRLRLSRATRSPALLSSCVRQPHCVRAVRQAKIHKLVNVPVPTTVQYRW